MHVSIIVKDADEACWQCKLLRLALICGLLRPHVCLRRCDEIVGLLLHHDRSGHAAWASQAAPMSLALDRPDR